MITDITFVTFEQLKAMANAETIKGEVPKGAFEQMVANEQLRTAGLDDRTQLFKEHLEQGKLIKIYDDGLRLDRDRVTVHGGQLGESPVFDWYVIGDIDTVCKTLAKTYNQEHVWLQEPEDGYVWFVNKDDPDCDIPF